ncbi:MAG: hypothetical protein AAFV93_10055, partial [Chloroflexota bacterium]
MNIKSLRRPANGWLGQALIEYHVIGPLMAIGIIIVVGFFGNRLAASYQEITDCVRAAELGTVNDDCATEVADSSNPSDDDTPPSGGDDDTPPMGGGNTPPSGGDDTPPSGGDDTPPSGGDDDTPPMGGGNTPPSGGDDTPPSGGDDGGSEADTSGDPDEDPDILSEDNGSESGDDTSEENDEVNTESVCLPDAAFDTFAAGTILSTQIPNVTISTNNSSNPPMVFDTANPTGGDSDLGTPHQDFGGPGHGDGGAAGQPGENSVALGNVIIISEDGDTSDPDDNGSGGQIIFDYTNPVNVAYIYMLDQDNDGVAATVELFDNNDSIIKTGTVDVPGTGNRSGDNGVYRVDLNTSGVYKIVFNLPGSGAVAAISCTESTVETGSSNSGDSSNTGDSSSDNTETDNSSDTVDNTPSFAVT